MMYLIFDAILFPLALNLRENVSFTGWSDSQLKNHCVRLVEMEYLLLHGGSRGHLLHYELLWDGDSTQTRHLCGLPDVDGLTNAPAKAEGSERKSAPEGGRSGTSMGQV